MLNTAWFSFPGKPEPRLSLSGPQFLWLRDPEHGACYTGTLTAPLNSPSPGRTQPPVSFARSVFSPGIRCPFWVKITSPLPQRQGVCWLFWEKALGEATKGRLGSDSTAGIAGVTRKEAFVPSPLSQAWRPPRQRITNSGHAPTPPRSARASRSGPQSQAVHAHSHTWPPLRSSRPDWLGSLCTQS